MIPNNPSSSTYYSEKELAQVHESEIPYHVAIIMDGNRRWAEHSFSKASTSMGGHWAGAKILLDIVRAAKEMGIKVLTVYGFSTENWGRSSLEVATLIEIFGFYLKEYRNKMIETGIKFNVIGDLTPFPPQLIEEIEKTKKETEKSAEIDFIVALNYGGRDDLKRGVQKLITHCTNNGLKEKDITETMISSFLDTASWKDPDLLIRTSGEMRLSNFLLWQLAYTEIYVTEVLWPDFTPQELLKAILSFQSRQRRMGR